LHLVECTNIDICGASNASVVKCLSYLGLFLNQNAELCLEISEAQIHRILSFSAKENGNQYLELIKYIIKPEGKVLKRNQIITLKYLVCFKVDIP
jgi:uncharacterized membrane protein